MKINEIFLATVMNNDDSKPSPTSDSKAFPPSGEGRIQIFAEPLMLGWTPSHYPWARPFYGNNLTQGVLDIPEKGSKVWVFYEQQDLMKNWFYFGYASFKRMNLVKKVTTFLNGMFKSPPPTGMGLKSLYPDVKLQYFKNGVIVGVSSSLTTPEIFIYHPKGSFFSIDSLGNINTKGTWKHFGTFETTGALKVVGVTASGNISTSGTITATGTITGSGVTLSTHVHPTAAPGAPSPPTPGT